MSLSNKIKTTVWRISPRVVGAPPAETVAAFGPNKEVSNLLVNW